MEGRGQKLHRFIGYNVSVKWLSKRRESTLGSSDIDLLMFDLQLYYQAKKLLQHVSRPEVYDPVARIRNAPGIRFLEAQLERKEMSRHRRDAKISLPEQGGANSAHPERRSGSISEIGKGRDLA